MEQLKRLKQIVINNLKTSTEVAVIKDIKAETRNLEAIKTVQALFEQYAV